MPDFKTHKLKAKWACSLYQYNMHSASYQTTCSVPVNITPV